VELLDDLRRRVACEPALAGLTCTYALVSKAGFRGRRALADDERLVDIAGLRW
jgi:hypothetical protein